MQLPFAGDAATVFVEAVGPFRYGRLAGAAEPEAMAAGRLADTQPSRAAVAAEARHCEGRQHRSDRDLERDFVLVRRCPSDSKCMNSGPGSVKCGVVPGAHRRACLCNVASRCQAQAGGCRQRRGDQVRYCFIALLPTRKTKDPEAQSDHYRSVSRCLVLAPAPLPLKRSIVP